VSSTTASRKAARQQRHQQDAERRARVKREAAETEEARQEAIVPAASRKPVLAADGSVFRAARVQIDGPAFIHSSALAHLYRRNPKITAEHLKAADRLAKAQQRSVTISIGSSNYGERMSGKLQTGSMSGYVQAIVDGQVDAAREVGAARSALGRWWLVVAGIVLDGMDATAWGAAHGIYRETAVEMLIVGLDRLVAFYGAEAVLQDEAPDCRIRAAHFS
jgi:hypothetical protein